MSEKKTGGPAFPTENEHQSGSNTYHYEGMTLRDYFAAKAMQAVLSTPAVLDGVIEEADEKGYALRDAAAVTAYSLADAMIKAREQ